MRTTELQTLANLESKDPDTAEIVAELMVMSRDPQSELGTPLGRRAVRIWSSGVLDDIGANMDEIRDEISRLEDTLSAMSKMYSDVMDWHLRASAEQITE